MHAVVHQFGQERDDVPLDVLRAHLGGEIQQGAPQTVLHRIEWETREEEGSCTERAGRDVHIVVVCRT